MMTSVEFQTVVKHRSIFYLFMYGVRDTHRHREVLRYVCLWFGRLHICSEDSCKMETIRNLPLLYDIKVAHVSVDSPIL